MILVGLYLSKFDKLGLKKLGFSSFQEAFNVLGYALNGNPASIKNYRDEFDPYFDNNRQGWHKRGLRNYCKVIMDYANEYDFEKFSDIISSYLVKNYRIKIEINSILNEKIEDTYVKRISTGLAAENFFIKNYYKIEDFKNFALQDTRSLGCGFDFKLNYEQQFYCIEVKGINEKVGNFLMTEKEYKVAKALRKNYCLYIVTNFKESPVEKFYFDPLVNFNLKEIHKVVEQISYQGGI